MTDDMNTNATRKIFRLIIETFSSRGNRTYDQTQTAGSLPLGQSDVKSRRKFHLYSAAVMYLLTCNVQNLCFTRLLVRIYQFSVVFSIFTSRYLSFSTFPTISCKAYWGWNANYNGILSFGTLCSSIIMISIIHQRYK